MFFIKNIFVTFISLLITILLFYLLNIFRFTTINLIECLYIFSNNVILNNLLIHLIYIFVVLLFSYVSLLINDKFLLFIYILLFSFLIGYIFIVIFFNKNLNISNIVSLTSVFIFDFYFIIISIKYS